MILWSNSAAKVTWADVQNHLVWPNSIIAIHKENFEKNIKVCKRISIFCEVLNVNCTNPVWSLGALDLAINLIFSFYGQNSVIDFQLLIWFNKQNTSGCVVRLNYQKKQLQLQWNFFPADIVFTKIKEKKQ